MCSTTGFKMTQINAFFYTVIPSERVTIIVTPERVGPQVVAANAGKVLKNVGGQLLPFGSTPPTIRARPHDIVQTFRSLPRKGCAAHQLETWAHGLIMCLSLHWECEPERGRSAQDPL
jgi:hypothetical protein